MVSAIISRIKRINIFLKLICIFKALILFPVLATESLTSYLKCL